MQVNAQLAQVSMQSARPVLTKTNALLALTRLNLLMLDNARHAVSLCKAVKNVHHLLFVPNVNQALTLEMISTAISAAKS